MPGSGGARAACHPTGGPHRLDHRGWQHAGRGARIPLGDGAAGAAAPAAAGEGAAITARTARLVPHSRDFVVVFQVDELGAGGGQGGGPDRGPLVGARRPGADAGRRRVAVVGPPGAGAAGGGQQAAGRYAVQSFAWISLSQPVPLAAPERAEFSIGPRG